MKLLTAVLTVTVIATLIANRDDIVRYIRMRQM
jgi:uncharacterized protein DUF6893